MELSADAQSWVMLVLVWIGFGTVVGVFANMFLPAGSPSGFFGNLVIGIAGTCLGPIAFVMLLKPKQFHPMSPVGFAIAVLTAVVLLLICRGIALLGKKRTQTSTEPAS